MSPSFETLSSLYPTLTFAPIDLQHDLPDMAAVAEAERQAGLVSSVTTLESLANTYAHLQNCHLPTDSVTVRENGQFIAFGRVLWERKVNTPTIDYYLVLRSDPSKADSELIRQILLWQEQRLAEIATTIPTPNTGNYSSYCSEQNLPRIEILKSLGYEIARYYHGMKRPLSGSLPDAPMPAGLEVRPVTPAMLPQVWEASVEAFRDEWGAAELSEEAYQQFLSDPTTNHALFQVAFDGDEIAGMVLNYIDEDGNRTYNRQRGYTEGITVRRPWRKRGLASALICRSMRMFKEMGMEEVALGVDSENPSGAQNLYRSLGYKAYRTEYEFHKPTPW